MLFTLSPQRRRLLAGSLTLLITSIVARVVQADPQDIVRDAIPQTWLDPFLPENLPELQHPSYFNDLDKAQAQAFHGRYRLALITLGQAKVQKPAQKIRADRIRAQSLAALGEFDGALAALTDGPTADNSTAQIQRVRLLDQLDRDDEALALLKTLLAAHPDSIGGHYWLGIVLERLGNVPEATRAYTWFVEKPQEFLERWQAGEQGPFDDAQNVTWIGQALDRWATLTQAYRNNPGLDRTILGIFVRVYDEIDREFWPAHVAAAEYFASHDQRKEAMEELAAALDANPNYEPAFRLLGRLKLQEFDFDTADECVDQMRGMNPDSVAADLLAARSFLAQRRPEEAEPIIQHVLRSHPLDIEALGLLAATSALQLKEDRTAAILAEVDKIDPTNASAYFEVAEQLASMRQYPRAAEKYKIAIARAPWWTAAQNGLGLLYTQSGDEQSAHVILNAAHELDPFNLATTNYLRLLDMMDGFARKESAHFIVIYDAKADPVIPEYFSDYLESVQADICGQFHYTPPLKTYIEVFPTHDAFSVRTTGSSWIGTVGASTGRVIALVSPRAGEGTMGTFNWAQVLRHEYTHTVTLGVTDNRIQHWMTEGLAVNEERAPLRWEWVPMLYHAVKEHGLFPLDKLTWAFVRPRRPIDRQLAYAESFWICKYVEQIYGHDAILRMLDDCRNAMPQEQFFPKETGRSMDQFQSDFFGWCDKQIASWGYDADTSKKYADLREDAEGLLKERNYAESAKKWEQIAVIRPVDALPHQRLAGLYLSKELHDPEKAIEQLAILEKVELKDNRYAKRIARLYRDEEKWSDEAKYALTAVYIDPYDASAHELLAGAYEKTGDQKGLERENRVLDTLAKWKAAQPTPDVGGSEKSASGN
jgi:predicted Zn-dependent protease